MTSRSHGRVNRELIFSERRFISLHRVHFSFFSARGIGISYRISRTRLKKKREKKEINHVVDERLFVSKQNMREIREMHARSWINGVRRLIHACTNAYD